MGTPSSTAFGAVSTVDSVALSTDAVVDELREVGYDASDVVEAGAGAWSMCFAFPCRGRDLVVRFGPHVEDFEKDRFAARFSCAAMPVPNVELLAAPVTAFMAVSTRAAGMHSRRSPDPSGIGLSRRSSSCWKHFGYGDPRRRIRCLGWCRHRERCDLADHLLAVRCSTGDRRPLDWYERLGDRPAVRAAFDDGFARLAGLDFSAAPRSLIHADLINRNVHVVGDRVTGVFDWGCGCYGDHLYDASWFEFWAPFHPHLDVDLLLNKLRHRWTGMGIHISGRRTTPVGMPAPHRSRPHRLQRHQEAWTDVDDVVARMHDLCLV